MKNKNSTIKNLSSKDRYNLKVWYVLKKIEEALLYSKDGSSFEYWTYSPSTLSDERFPTSHEEGDILDQLIYKKALKRKEPDTIAEIGARVASDEQRQMISITYLEKLPKIKDILQEYEKLTSNITKRETTDFTIITNTQKQQTKKDIYSCSSLYVDFDGCVMRYGENPPIEISPETQEIKLLKLLLTRNALVQIIVEYWEIAKKLNLRSYQIENHRNQRYARDVQYVRRNLGHILGKSGMTDIEINKMIIPKKGLGYILRCT
ncbi:MAG: hypothetical protein ABIP54_00235 [Candidatus Andersenbacteria bacterium]